MLVASASLPALWALLLLCALKGETYVYLQQYSVCDCFGINVNVCSGFLL